MDNETWIIEEGRRAIEIKAGLGFDRLNQWERLVYSLWVADYGMRNAGDLDTARDVYADFQSTALQAADWLSLPLSRAMFQLTASALEERYFELFDPVCSEIRSAGGSALTDVDCK